MFAKASGDGPRAENPSAVQRKSDVISWRMSYEAWQTFNDLREKGLFFDVCLITDDDRSFAAHRIVLCTCGHYFRSLFSGRWRSSEQREIKIPGVKAELMECVIKFAYTREMTINSTPEAKELLVVGSHFGVDEIIRKCADHLISELSIKNCLELWRFARTYYCKRLEEQSFSFILEDFPAVAAMPAADGSSTTLYQLDVDELRRILESDQLNIRNEKLPLRVVLGWVQINPNKRKKDVYQLLSAVRLGLLDERFLSLYVKELDYIRDCPKSRCLVQQIILLLKLKDSMADDKSTFPRLVHRMTDDFLIASTSRSLSWTECEVLRQTSRPRFPREIMLVIGGWSGNTPTSSTESYDPVTRTWNDTDLALPLLLKRPRAYHGVSYLAGSLYVIGGFDGQTTYNSCERYNLVSGTWKKLCGMYFRRCYVGVTQLDSSIYAIGGSEGGGEQLRLKSVERYDPTTNVWLRLPDMNERRSDAGVCGLRGRIYVVGGFTGHQCVFSVEYFDVESHQWTRATPMRIPRSGVTIVPYKGRVIALGGFDGNASRLRSVEALDTDLNSWTSLPDMLVGRSNFGASVVDGRLVVVGGFNGSSTCSNVEYYDDDGEGDDNNDLVVKNKPEQFRREEPSTSTSSTQANGSGDYDDDYNEGSSSTSTEEPSRSREINYHQDVATGVWRNLPDMKISRSALSCCVVNGLPPTYLRSIVSPLECGDQQQRDVGTAGQWSALDRLMVICIKNGLHNR